MILWEYYNTKNQKQISNFHTSICLFSSGKTDVTKKSKSTNFLPKQIFNITSCNKKKKKLKTHQLQCNLGHVYNDHLLGLGFCLHFHQFSLAPPTIFVWLAVFSNHNEHKLTKHTLFLVK